MARQFSDTDVQLIAETLDVYFDLYADGGKPFYLDVISAEYGLSRATALSLASAYSPHGNVAALTAALRSL